MSPAFARNRALHVVLEVNRPWCAASRRTADHERAPARDILAVYTYVPEIQQRQLRTADSRTLSVEANEVPKTKDDNDTPPGVHR